MTADRFLDIACFENYTTRWAMFGGGKSHSDYALRRKVIRLAWWLAHRYGHTHLTLTCFADAAVLDVGTIHAAVTGMYYGKRRIAA